jgi:nicotinamide-nucleotide amidase
MPIAEIISIGTEILLGDILDTNAQYIARTLKDTGIDLYRKTTIGDNASRIAQALKESLERCDIVITSGGLGPTVDDLTREGVALAVGVPTEYHPELWEQIQERFQRFGRQPTENNKRQAYLPIGALPVENQVGTAPAFIVNAPGDKSIISLPGVPREMEYLLEKAVLPYLVEHYKLTGIIKSLTIHTAGAGESQIDDLIGDLERMSNPTVGLSAHAGQVDVRITAKADTMDEADKMLRSIEGLVRERLGNWIYGVDGETLQGVALNRIASLGWNLCVVEAGLNGRLTQKLASAEGPFLGGEVLTQLPEPSLLESLTRDFRSNRRADVALGVGLYASGEKHNIHLFMITPKGEKTISRSYGGPPQLAPSWAVNLGLDWTRKLEKKDENEKRD